MKKITNWFVELGVGLSLLISGSVHAATYTKENLLNGWNVYLTNNTTTLYYSTNTVYQSPLGIVSQPFAPVIQNNLYYSWTSNYFIGTGYVNSAWYTNTFQTNLNNFIYKGAFSDVYAYQNALGDPGSAALVLHVLPDSATATNNFTIQLRHSDATNSFVGGASPVFSVTWAYDATNSWLRTNIPTSFMQGGGHIRIHSWQTANLAGSGNTNFFDLIDQAYLEGNVP